MKAELHIEPMGHKCRVVLDGNDISSGVRAFALSANVHEITTLSLDIIMREITDVSGEVHVDLIPASREALLRLGWTPPSVPVEANEPASGEPSAAPG